MKQGTIVVESGKPLQFREAVELDTPPSAEHKGVVLIAAALKAHRAAAHELLAGKYACYAELAPQHLRIPCDIMILRCKDGVFVRYDKTAQGDPKTRAGSSPQSIAELVPQLSERMIHFGPPAEQLDANQLGPALTIDVKDPTGVTKQTLTLYPGIYASAELPSGFEVPKPPARPVCLVSIQNDITFQMQGITLPVDAPLGQESQDADQFIAQTRFKLPVGWEAIEIYPILGDEYWRAEYAPLWAEADILACAALRNLQTVQLNALDPHTKARERYAALLTEFESLLTGPEEPVHQFLREHPELISPTRVKCWSKLAFGAKKSDFVFLEPGNDYEIVELEAPFRELFRKDGHPRSELNDAINQLRDWVRYIEDNKSTVERELGLRGISASPRRLVIIGRSASLTEENRRILTTLQNDQPKLRVLTYDDLLTNARSTLENILGPLVLTGENTKMYFFK